jgi:hypothetical protein
VNEGLLDVPGLAAGHGDLRLGLEERLAAAVDVSITPPTPGSLPQLAERRRRPGRPRAAGCRAPSTSAYASL